MEYHPEKKRLVERILADLSEIEPRAAYAVWLRSQGDLRRAGILDATVSAISVADPTLQRVVGYRHGGHLGKLARNASPTRTHATVLSMCSGVISRRKTTAAMSMASMATPATRTSNCAATVPFGNASLMPKRKPPTDNGQSSTKVSPSLRRAACRSQTLIVTAPRLVKIKDRKTTGKHPKTSVKRTQLGVQPSLFKYCLAPGALHRTQRSGKTAPRTGKTNWAP